MRLLLLYNGYVIIIIIIIIIIGHIHTHIQNRNAYINKTTHGYKSLQQFTASKLALALLLLLLLLLSLS